MKCSGKKISKMLLMGLLISLLLAPTAVAADEQVSLVLNGQEYQANVYRDKGVSYISAASLGNIPGLAVEQKGTVPLREFFETRGGKVSWDHNSQKIIVSWHEMKGKWSADDLMIEATKKLQELNTYKMKGNATMKMAMAGSAVGEIPEIPEITTYLEGVFQQNPLAMYMKQTVDLPMQDMEMTEEELALLGQGSMDTEMVWTENKIYQKMPFGDQWISQDLAEMDMMENLTSMIQTSPQQSLELMRKFGIIYVFGDDVVINGQEYYTVKNYIDSATFKKVIEEFMGNMNLQGLMPEIQDMPGQNEEEMDVMMEELQQMIEHLLSTMEIDYYVNTYINKETLLTESMSLDMKMKFKIDEKMSPAGAINFEMKMIGEYELYDFGTEMQLPDVRDAITQQEFLEQMMNTMELPKE